MLPHHIVIADYCDVISPYNAVDVLRTASCCTMRRRTSLVFWNNSVKNKQILIVLGRQNSAVNLHQVVTNLSISPVNYSHYTQEIPKVISTICLEHLQLKLDKFSEHKIGFIFSLMKHCSPWISKNSQNASVRAKLLVLRVRLNYLENTWEPIDM